LEYQDIEDAQKEIRKAIEYAFLDRILEKED
jgi:hypothetical protein